MSLNIDDFLPGTGSVDKIREQVQTIRRTHGKVFPWNYSLTWVIANQVVQRYYGKLGLDAIPQWRDNFGWKQFNLMRASNCLMPSNASEESQRYILFDAIAVNWKKGGESDSALADVANAILVDHLPPDVAVYNAVDHLGLEEQSPYDHSSCLHGPLAYAYTKLFQVVTDLICRAPEMVGKRELTIDITPFGQVRDEPSHPLRKLGLEQPGITRDWFELFHVPANSRIYINVVNGDIMYTEPDDTARALDYPGWNELNEDQLTAYFAGMLRIGG
jgi:hypothetical protein